MRLIDFDKIPFLAIPIAPVVKGESVHYEQGALKEWFDGTQDVEAVPLDRIKQAREEMVNGMPSMRTEGQLTGEDVVFSTACECYAECIMILDKLIAEVEGKA